MLTKTRLRELVKEVDPNEQLEEDVEDLMLQISDEFVDELVRAACMFAKHRKSNIVEVKDVQVYLGKHKFNYKQHYCLKYMMHFYSYPSHLYNIN